MGFHSDFHFFLFVSVFSHRPLETGNSVLFVANDTTVCGEIISCQPLDPAHPMTERKMLCRICKFIIIIIVGGCLALSEDGIFFVGNIVTMYIHFPI